MTRLRLIIYRFRRPLAAASAALAVLLLATSLRPASTDPIDIVVASQPLPPGSALEPGDLAIAQVPAEYVVPGTIVAIDDAVGRTIAGGIDAGEPVTRSRLVSTRPRDDGLHTVPVRLADAEAADLLEPGSVVDLVLTSQDPTARDTTGGDADAQGTTGQVIAQGVQVVTVPRRATSSGLGPGTRSAGSLIVVATDRRTAVALAAVGTQSGLGVVLR